MIRRLLPVFIVAASLGLARAQSDVAPLLGRVVDHTYISPTGAFRVTLPIFLELDGVISDTPNVVTFHDDFTHISMGAFPQDMTQKWELETAGPKEYLQKFFEQFVFTDFYRSNPRVTLDPNARFNPQAFGGSLVTFVSLPGGSMFDDPALRIAPPAAPPVAKRGNLLFVHDGFVYVISMELPERVTEGSAYALTPDQENTLLRDRLFNLAAKIRFTTPPPAAP